ncbi:Retrovirus-related Pol polyprotein from transposon opus [Nosema granulosis]|uniref:Retrovirus-related Pol polyprotein from transposon opus n=1 Tax=Nosema granulosis TaxID=83296 RepID=A0A9P6KYI6_9MICR|nr:Retrovirus-related Pol polyprotein from transposon opus [Nosema granulosis]
MAKKSNPYLGDIKSVEHEIKLSSDKLVTSKPYSIPSKLFHPMVNEIETLVKDKIIQESNSPYASPTFPILKKNGTIRLIVDYRKLNQITIKEVFFHSRI